MFLTSIDSLTLVVSAFVLKGWLDRLDLPPGYTAAYADLVLRVVVLLAFAIGLGGAFRRALGL